MALSVYYIWSISSVLMLFYVILNADDSVVVIGGYSEQDGLLFASLNEENGVLSHINGPFNVGPNPSTITLNQQENYNMIYTVNEAGDKSALVTIPFDPSNNYSIDTNGIKYQSSFGETPCYITHDVNMTFIYVANYGGGGHNSSFSVYKINQQTGYLSDEPIIYKTFDDPNIVSHVHCIVPNPNNIYNFYIADLGRDIVEHYTIIENENDTYSVELISWLDFAMSSGPRTLSYNPLINGILYLSQELANKVSVLTFDINNYKLLNIEQTVSTLFANNTEKSACSHVQTDNNGKYLYVANRFTDNIASFIINENTGLLQEESLYINECGGQIPRYFNVDPTNNYMLICNQEGEQTNVATYTINHDDNGHLTSLSSFECVRPSWAYIIAPNQLQKKNFL